MFREIWFPTAANLEIPESEFWKMTPRMLNRRLPYFEQMQKHKRQSMYNTAWLNGQYVNMAVVASLSKNYEYPEKPPELYPEDMPEEVKKKEIVQNAADEFRRLMTAHNAEMDKKEVKGNA